MPTPCISFYICPLLADGALVESKLLTLQDVTIDTAGLARSRRDDGVETTSLKLLLESGLDLAVGSKASSLLLLDALALLLLGGLSILLLLPSAANGLAVVSLVPLSEGSGIDLDNSGLGEGVGADKLVVGRVVRDHDHSDLASDTLRTP